MYDELILKLREIEAMCETTSFEEAANVLKEAADAKRILRICKSEPPKEE